MGIRRMNWSPLGLTALAVATLLPLGAAAQTPPDEEGVRRAALDYLEGFYEGSDEKLTRGVHPEVVKFGFSFRDGAYNGSPMSFSDMFEFAAAVRAGRVTTPEDAPKEVILLDIQDQIAVVKVIAWWGSDYLQMARYDGAWKIVHILWQTPPR